jgi:hypothetical protein
MNSSNARRPTWLLMAGLPLALLLTAGGAASRQRVAPMTAVLQSAAAPAAAVQGMSFSLTADSPAVAAGIHPADILGIGGLPLIPCENLGLLCAGGSGALDDVSSLSYGDDFGDDDLPALQFSVGQSAHGRAGTAVYGESQCNPAQAQPDVFESALHGDNVQDLDGDGVACAANVGYGLGLSESAQADDVDALARDPCLSVDLNCDGWPEAPIYLTLAQGSPTLGLLDASPADILVSGQEYTPIIWAAGEQLGLTGGDEIDALCLREDGDGLYDEGDLIVFSLTAVSPSLWLIGAGPGDLLRNDPLRRVVVASAAGLVRTDNVDALSCTQLTPEALDESLYLPLIRQP